MKNAALKKLFAIVLVITMCVSLLPVSAAAEEPAGDAEQTEEVVYQADQEQAEEEMQDDEQIDEEPDEDEQPDEGETPETVCVIFACDPAETEVTVRDAEGAEIAPEEDGSYLLVPGSYTYSASCEGYVYVENVEFIIDGGTETMEIEISLQAVQNSGTGDEAEALKALNDETLTDVYAKTNGIIASGECGAEGVYLKWTLNKNGVLTISGTGAMMDYADNEGFIMPLPWESYAAQIKTIVIDNGVTTIGLRAFEGCSSLSTVIIPDSVTSIGADAFMDCTSLTHVTIPAGVTRIGDAVWNVFVGCSALTAIDVDPQNQSFTSKDGILYDETMEWLLVCPEGKTGVLTIPDGVKAVVVMAAIGCDKLTGIKIPDSLTDISFHAFQNCTGLTKLTIPESVTRIGFCAFSGCDKLKEIEFCHPAGAALTFENLHGTSPNAFSSNTKLATTIKVPDVNKINTSISKYDWAGDNRTITYESSSIISTGFKFGVDTFPFDNSSLAFGDSHYISYQDYVKLLEQVPLLFKYEFLYDKTYYYLEFPNDHFKGVCFGMSALMGLLFYDYVNLDSYVQMCVEPNQLPFPVNYPELESLFNYTNVLQRCYQPIIWEEPQSALGWRVVDDLLNKKLVIMCFQDHAVLGYAIDPISDDEYYIVYYADPDLLTAEPVTLEINKKSFEIRETSKLRFNYLVDDFEDLAAKLPDRSRPSSATIKTQAMLWTSVTSFTISGGGQSSTVNGSEISGNFPIYILPTINGDGNNSYLYGISESREYDVDIGSGGNNHIGVYFPDADSVTITESDASHYHFKPNGEASLSGATAPSVVRTNAAFDDIEQLVSISGSFSDLTLQPSASKLKIQSSKKVDGWDILISSDNGEQKVGTDKSEANVILVKDNASGEEPYYTIQLEDGTIISEEQTKYILSIPASEGLNEQSYVYIDGIEHKVEADNTVIITTPNANTMVTYSYNDPNAADPHSKYPTGMKVWKLKLENNSYTAKRIPEFDDLLRYSGCSIRITGNKGIRMITSVDGALKASLINDSVAGYTLEEYGTLLCFSSEMVNGSLCLEDSYARHNYAYSRAAGTDPVFKYVGSTIQYTNVLVGFDLKQCADDIAMRPYIVLSDESGNRFTIYGGIVQRSIGYIAYQNRSAFASDDPAYDYIWDIIHHVYGDKYDADYKK